MSERFTVLGASGFIGSRLARRLRAAGHAVATPDRDAPLPDDELGHVIYAIGLTADFRRRPYDTMDAHVTLVGRLLRRARFASFLYLSSTRVYGAGGTGRECDALSVRPSDPGDLYNISKLAGEALCLAHGNAHVRIARLSNVYDANSDDGAESANFLPSVLADARAGAVAFATGPDSAKDYVRIDDVCRALERIALGGTARCYNVASGENVSNGRIAAALARRTGCTVRFATDAPTHAFPAIDTTRIAALFAQASGTWRPARLIDDLPRMVAAGAGRTAA